MKASFPPKLPVTLAPGSSLTFEVAFRPLAPAQRQAVILMRSDDAGHPELRAPVQGTGLGAAPSIDAVVKGPPFGVVKVGTDSKPPSP